MTAIILVALVAVALGLFARYGGFVRVRPEVQTSGGEWIVCREVTGDYRQTSVVAEEVYHCLLHDFNMPTTQGIAVFYDNPKTTAKEKRRSKVGCIVEPDEAARLKQTSCRYEIRQLPVEEALTAEFPYRGKASVPIGLMKVYPALEKISRATGSYTGSVIEIYDIPDKKTVYRKLNR